MGGMFASKARLFVCGSLGAYAMMQSAPAFARDTAGENAGNEIIVTAQFRG